ncbi:MAG: SRPBCC family protein [Deltaproteobacteria bacterium]|nr:SRPBCC family protein [Deltaproteobacteria bacterium]
MTHVSMKTTLNAAAEQVWRTVSDFNGLDKFVGAVASSSVNGTGIGAERTLSLQDGGRIVEKLVRLDNDTRTLQYSIVSSPLPVKNYISKITIKKLGRSQCEITWSSTFYAKGIPEKEAEKVIEGIYAMGFKGLKKLYS